MQTIVLVGCSKLKLDRAAPARELYSPSHLFRLARAWAEERADKWFVLSARHGLVDPGQIVRPYDWAITDLDALARRKWGLRTAGELLTEIGDGEVEVTILAGRPYVDALVHGLSAPVNRKRLARWCVTVQLQTPLSGLGIGRRRSWLARETSRQLPLEVLP